MARQRTTRGTSAAQTRRKLLDAGRAAFAELGHDGVNLQRDILDRAGVSTGSFYHQFADKTELLVAILEEAVERAQSGLTATLEATGDPVEGTRAGYELLFAMVDAAEDLVRIQFRERDNHDERVRRLLERIRQSWLDSLTASYQRLTDRNPGFDPGQGAQMVRALTIGVLFAYLDTPPKRRAALRKELIDALVPFTLGGLEALGARRT
ncbi:MAG TPA: TetR/AcrR family transcriptional regulator [Acidimicrobiales bacterium]